MSDDATTSSRDEPTDESRSGREAHPHSAADARRAGEQVERLDEHDHPADDDQGMGTGSG